VPGTFHLCYITDRHQLPPASLWLRIKEAIRAGVDLVQIREKDLPTRELLGLVSAAMAAAGGPEGAGSLVVVNDRLDVAWAAHAHGVHLGTRSLPARVVRGIVSCDFLVGVSCHSLQEALAAESAGADYLVLGPIFETPAKLAFGPPLGLGKLQEVTSRVRIPVLALGGITRERAPACRDAGATGIAGIRIFQECDSLEPLVGELLPLFTV
jgi:thiamine-phosphate pyrophosphorylase